MGAFDAIQFKPEFPFSILNRVSTDSGRFANAEFEPGFKSKKAFQRAAKPVLPRVGIEHPKLTLSPPISSPKSAPLCAAPYPAGDGSAAIFRSMPANSRRVR